MTLEDQVLFQFYNIKGYDFETSQNKAVFSQEKDEVDPESSEAEKASNLEKDRPSRGHQDYEA